MQSNYESYYQGLQNGEGQSNGFNSKSQKRMQRKLRKHEGAINSLSLDKDKYGHGLVTERRYTDMFWCIAFATYIFILFCIGGYSAVTGDPKKLVAHQDGQRRFCGVDEAVEDYPKVYWTFEYQPSAKSETEGMFMSAVCIKECPTETKTAELDCVNTEYTSKCGTTTDVFATRDLFGLCVVKDVEHLPSDIKDKVTKFTAQLQEGDSGKVIEDLSNSWRDIVTCLVLAIIYALIYMYLMSQFPTAIAYTAVGLTEAGFIIGTIALLAGAAMAPAGTPNGDDQVKGMLVGAGVLVVINILFMCGLYCFWAQFKVGIAIVDATADFFVATKRIILVSVGTFFLEFILVLCCTMILLGIYSSGNIVASQSEVDITRQGKIVWLEGHQYWFLAALFFGFCWVSNYLKNQTVLTLMCSVSTYYFSSDSTGEGSADVGTALYWSNVYHAGSVAFGSLIMAIVNFVQAIIDGARQEGDDMNAEAACTQCCLQCIEDMIEYITTIAYANMAVSGDPFCSCAWNGFLLNLIHLIKFHFAQSLASAFVFLGFLFVTFANVISYLLVSKYVTNSYDNITFKFIPITIVVVFTFITCGIFMGLFDEAVNATLQCMAIDKQLSPDGSCKYGPPTMHEKLRAIYGDDYDTKSDPFKNSHPVQQIQMQQMVPPQAPPIQHPGMPMQPTPPPMQAPMMGGGHPGMMQQQYHAPPQQPYGFQQQQPMGGMQQYGGGHPGMMPPQQQHPGMYQQQPGQYGGYQAPHQQF